MVTWRYECDVCQEPKVTGTEPKLCHFRSEAGEAVQVSACGTCAKLIDDYVLELQGGSKSQKIAKIGKAVAASAPTAMAAPPAPDMTALLLETNLKILEALNKLNGTGQQATEERGEDRPAEKPKRSNRNTGTQNKKPKGRSRAN